MTPSTLFLIALTILVVLWIGIGAGDKPEGTVLPGLAGLITLMALIFMGWAVMSAFGWVPVMTF